MEGRSEGVAETVRRDRPRHRSEWGIEFSRIVAFSDGVFAITLLVLQFDVPDPYAAPTSLVIAAVFLLSIPIALIEPLAATLIWPFIFFTGRRVIDRVQDVRA